MKEGGGKRIIMYHASCTEKAKITVTKQQCRLLGLLLSPIIFIIFVMDST